MAPTVKDVANSTPASTSTLPSAQAANPPQAAARPQPVPLEVPVSVNGARTIEGSDKREPFSESTKTVLVFANGAVIRLASNVAPGQLLFVTNDKSKKEVVCQVVKSKNYRTVTGYVELEFTEPAPGFWGVRIPTESAPAHVQPKAPVTQRPGAPPAAVSPAIGLPKAAAPGPPIPATTQMHAPVALPANPVIAPSSVSSVSAPKPEAIASHVSQVTPALPVPAKTGSLPSQLAAQVSALVVPEPVAAPSSPAEQGVASPASQKSSDASTEELRQQAARLQEQLSSLLFRESASEKATVPPPPALAPPAVAAARVPQIPKEMLRGADALQQAVAELEASSKPEAKPEHKPEPKIEPIKVSSIPTTAAETKMPSMISKSSSISLPAEEVKIPSWLAPLARETETVKEVASALPASLPSTDEVSSYGNSEELTVSIATDPTQKAQTVVFGGQLLGGSGSTDVQVASSGSKKGLVFGLVAASLLAAAGVAWYGLQPGNFLASKLAPPVTVQNNMAASSEPTVKTDSPTTMQPGPASSTSPVASSLVANSRPATTIPSAGTPPPTSRNSNPVSVPEITKVANAAERNVPEVEATKKPILGEVRLATPTVNRKANSIGTEAAPSIDDADASNAGDPLTGLAANHSKVPSAPVPVGGDVKTAKLLKSVPPVYPPTARSQRISGDVKLDALIDESGNVSATQIISGPTMLHQAAITAVKQWKYQPAQLNGSATSMHLTVTVQFRLQ